jgi:hypothetical protein
MCSDEIQGCDFGVTAGLRVEPDSDATVLIAREER